jgi:hypothetical protein
VFPHSPWSQTGPSEIARFERSERGKRRKRKMIMMIFHTLKESFWGFKESHFAVSFWSGNVEACKE